jgi:hypothetical protein
LIDGHIDDQVDGRVDCRVVPGVEPRSQPGIDPPLARSNLRLSSGAPGRALPGSQDSSAFSASGSSPVSLTADHLGSNAGEGGSGAAGEVAESRTRPRGPGRHPFRGLQRPRTDALAARRFAAAFSFRRRGGPSPAPVTV